MRREFLVERVREMPCESQEQYLEIKAASRWQFQAVVRDVDPRDLIYYFSRYTI